MYIVCSINLINGKVYYSTGAVYKSFFFQRLAMPVAYGELAMGFSAFSAKVN